MEFVDSVDNVTLHFVDVMLTSFLSYSSLICAFCWVATTVTALKVLGPKGPWI